MELPEVTYDDDSVLHGNNKLVNDSASMEADLWLCWWSLTNGTYRLNEDVMVLWRVTCASLNILWLLNERKQRFYWRCLYLWELTCALLNVIRFLGEWELWFYHGGFVLWELICVSLNLIWLFDERELWLYRWCYGFMGVDLCVAQYHRTRTKMWVYRGCLLLWELTCESLNIIWFVDEWEFRFYRRRSVNGLILHGSWPVCRSILHGSSTKGDYDYIEDVMVLWELTCASLIIIWPVDEWELAIILSMMVCGLRLWTNSPTLCIIRRWTLYWYQTLG